MHAQSQKVRESNNLKVCRGKKTKHNLCCSVYGCFVVFGGSLFVFLSILSCLSLFDLRLLIVPFVSPNYSWTCWKSNLVI